MTYTEQERRRATAWKSSTTTLPAAARAAAPWSHRPGPPYDFCLPVEHAALTLLPEVRQTALELFAAESVQWHAGTPAGPGNHLLSSQVQCVNALGQMVHDPTRLQRAFGLAGSEVLQIEPGRFLTFEYIGPTDFFGEVPRGARTRGAHCTSVDAAFLHRRQDGLVELVLVEWKYTESYSLRRPEPAKDEERRRRYEAALLADDAPVRSDLLPFHLLLDEPLYQRVRQQLLAHELEKARAHGADVVRVVHVLSPDNVAYQQSLVRDESRALGSTVEDVWRQLLVRPDRFSSLDPAVFLDADVTSAEYVRRYGAVA